MESPQSFNPYAPPQAASDEPVPDLRLDAELASRWQRLGGALFDGLLQALTLIPAYTATGLAVQRGVKVKNPFFLFTHSGTGGIVAAVAWTILLVVQWWLLVKRGQTVGKMVAGTRVVLMDGSPAGFASVLMRRTWPVWALEILGKMVSRIALIGIIDDLFVFRRDRRCLHDLIAGTKVVRTTGLWIP